MKNMKYAILGSTLAFAAMLALPAASLAATYLYVTVTGEVKTIEADSASQALVMPSDMDANSGVMLMNGPEDAAIEDEHVMNP